MKTRIHSFVSWCVLLCGMVFMTGCNPESLSVHDVEGEYDGKIETEIDGIPQGVVSNKAHAVVTSPDNLKLRVQFEDIRVVSYQLGSFSVDCGVQYDEKSGAFNLYGEPYVIFDNYGKLPVKVSGTATGGIITLGLDISAPLNLKMTYTGFLKK